MGFESDYNLYIVVPITCNALENLKDDEEYQRSEDKFMYRYFKNERFFLNWYIETGKEITFPKTFPKRVKESFMDLPEGYKLLKVMFNFKYQFSKEVKGFVDLFVHLTKDKMIFAIGNYICSEYDIDTPYEILLRKKVEKKTEERKSVETNQKDGENEKNDALLCIICFEREKSVLFFPCKHVCTCKKCSSQLLSCPVCKQKTQEKIDIFIS